LMRALRSGQKLPLLVIVFITQVSTMLLIGLWHGVTWNFALWGLWHGVGLFIHNRWSEYTRARAARWASTPLRAGVLNLSGIFLTFNFVSIGWVFFSTSSLSLAWNFLSKLVFWS
jgi:alginate O-acetyltransferase complex protein AlgI